MLSDIESMLKRLPPMSADITKLMAALDAGNAGASELEKMLLGCPVIAGRVLQMANSSFYGFPRQIESVREACVILGGHTLKNLVYTLAIMDRFKKQVDDKQEGEHLYARVWRHSLFAACIAKVLAKPCQQNPDQLFTAGLFNYLGLIILDYFETKKLASALALSAETHLPLSEITNQELGCNYLALSYSALNYWRFPEEVCDILKSLLDAKGGTAAQVLSLANFCASALGYRVAEGPASQGISADCLVAELSDFHCLPDLLAQAEILFEQLAQSLLDA